MKETVKEIPRKKVRVKQGEGLISGGALIPMMMVFILTN
jgi:hypothetical protein